MPKKEIYNKYKTATNMTYSQLLRWSKNPISQTASQQPNEESKEASKERARLLRNYVPNKLKPLYKTFNTAQIRNLVLLKTSFKDWDAFLEVQAKKAISYLARAKKGKGIINKRALKNWGFDRDK